MVTEAFELIDRFEKAVDANGYRTRDRHTEEEYRTAKAALESALSAAEPVTIAYRHTLHSVRGQTDVEVNTSANHPFGRPGVDYSSEYRTTTEPLYAAPQSVDVKDILAELDNVLVNDDQDRETLAKIRTMVSALSTHEQDVAVPDGWKIVPKNPTEEMCVAGCHHEHLGDIAGRYRAMLAASPEWEG